MSAAQLRLGDQIFDAVSRIQPERQPDGTFVEYHAHKAYENEQNLQLNRFGCGPFCNFTIPAEQDHACVYAFTVNGKVVYIGRTDNLASQFNEGCGEISPSNCYVEGQSMNCMINANILEHARGRNVIELWSCRVPDPEAVESRLVRELEPRWNSPIPART